MAHGRKALKSLFLTAALAATGAAAEDAAEPGISIELSAAEAAEGACKLSFVVQNPHAKDVEQAVYETVLFGAQGQVARLTLLDFQDLPAGRLRVRQFQFPHTCADISRVLINGAATCTGGGLPDGACSRGLRLSSKVMELAG
ncbi:hypothetical protein J4729_08075 [Leisingera sp. HS039]|uniref:hypothetical protein n=1 Tax=unclassified Leisingera TaxID=2614906 RepID=UPI0010707476|nr:MULTISPECIES: hypothetical protein [unclassified Leisingera]MBQ4824505.1 hypothetical protein [Leisingera sp. HS039]QBR38854.1 hypothetical protein ETW23_23620 [Leisingera sp. NJS201]